MGTHIRTTAFVMLGAVVMACDRERQPSGDIRMAQDSAPPSASIRQPSEDPSVGPQEPPPHDTLSLMELDRVRQRELPTDTGPRALPREPRR